MGENPTRVVCICMKLAKALSRDVWWEGAGTGGKEEARKREREGKYLELETKANGGKC